MSYDLGYVDLEQRNFQSIDRPFGSRVSPMPQVRSATYASGLDTDHVGAGDGNRTHDIQLGKLSFYH